MRRRRTTWKDDVAAIDAGITRLEQELADTRRELIRVTAQRDELRRVMGDVRRYAREEANRANIEQVQAVIKQLNTASGRPRPDRAEKIDGKARPTGDPIHLAAHVQDPGDPSHTGKATWRPGPPGRSSSWPDEHGV